MDSMIKHEPVAQLLAAASMDKAARLESPASEAYKKLRSRDFEVKKASFLMPTTKQWPTIAAEVRATSPRWYCGRTGRYSPFTQRVWSVRVVRVTRRLQTR